jgi:hypothetical protein
MAATRIFSTAAYLCAAVIALILSMLPKFGEIIATIPPGRPRRGGDRPLRDDRHARRADLGGEQGRLRQSDQSQHRRGVPHRRDCEFHLDSRRSPVRRNRTGLRLGDHRLPGDEGDRPVARNGSPMPSSRPSPRPNRARNHQRTRTQARGTVRQRARIRVRELLHRRAWRRAMSGSRGPRAAFRALRHQVSYQPSVRNPMAGTKSDDHHFRLPETTCGTVSSWRCRKCRNLA